MNLFVFVKVQDSSAGLKDLPSGLETDLRNVQQESIAKEKIEILQEQCSSDFFEPALLPQTATQPVARINTFSDECPGLRQLSKHKRLLFLELTSS